MPKKYLHLIFLIVFTAPIAKAQTDSAAVKAHPAYDSVTPMHRRLFGENFRKEWAAPVSYTHLTLPTKRIV